MTIAIDLKAFTPSISDRAFVEIYRLGQSKEVLDNPKSLSGEDILADLIVDLSEIF